MKWQKEINSSVTDDLMNIRNYVLNLGEQISNHFSQFVKDSSDTFSTWKAINSITRKNSKKCGIASNIPPDSFNDHFLSLSTRLFQSLKESSSHGITNVLLPCLTSAGETEDPLIHFIYHHPLFMKLENSLQS